MPAVPCNPLAMREPPEGANHRAETWRGLGRGCPQGSALGPAAILCSGGCPHLLLFLPLGEEGGEAVAEVAQALLLLGAEVALPLAVGVRPVLARLDGPRQPHLSKAMNPACSK